MFRTFFSFILLLFLLSCSSIYTPDEPKKKEVKVNTAQERLEFEQRMKKLRDKRTAKIAKKFEGETEQRKKSEAERLLKLQNNKTGRASFYAMQARKYLYKDEDLKMAYIYSKKAIELDPNNKDAKKVYSSVNRYFKAIENVRNKINYNSKLNSKQKQKLLKELNKSLK